MSKPVLAIIICSTRPGRIGKPIGDWFTERAQRDGSFEVDVHDLKELNFPAMDEPKHPRFADYQHEHTKKWSAAISRADAVVFVTPEYNYSMTGPTKNAIDYLFVEWGRKPVGFVSYGGMSGGIRAVQMLKQPLTTVGMYPASATVAIPNVAEMFDAERTTFTPTDLVEESARALLKELAKTAPLLATLRDS